MTNNEEKIAVVSYSTGKDGLAALLIALDEYGPDRVVCVSVDTGNEHEFFHTHLDYTRQRLNIKIDVLRADFTSDIERKRKYIAEKWPGKGVSDDVVERALKHLHPTGNPFLDLCMLKGRFPSRMAQFCTQELKKKPLDAYMTALMGQGYKWSQLESWRGIRRDESAKRADAQEHEVGDWIIRHPIAHWTAQQTVDFVKSRGVELNPLYSMGMGRVGCMPCINCGKDELAEIAKRFPEHIDRIREWEELVRLASKRGFATFFATDPEYSYIEKPGWTYAPEKIDVEGAEPIIRPRWMEPDSDIYERGRIDNRVEWAKTSHGGKQYDLMRFMPANQCSSLYGLCE